MRYDADKMQTKFIDNIDNLIVSLLGIPVAMTFGYFAEGAFTYFFGNSWDSKNSFDYISFIAFVSLVFIMAIFLSEVVFLATFIAVNWQDYKMAEKGRSILFSFLILLLSLASLTLGMRFRDRSYLGAHIIEDKGFITLFALIIALFSALVFFASDDFFGNIDAKKLNDVLKLLILGMPLIFYFWFIWQELVL